MRILFAGDMAFKYFDEFPGTEKAYKTFGETAEVFSEYDFSVLNLENVLGNTDDFEPIIKSGPNLISEDDYIEYVDALKPSAVGMANNHSLDYGDGALYHTVQLLKDRNYQVFGVGENIEEAYKPAVFEKDGIKVAIIGVCENEFGIAEKNSPGTAGYRLGRVSRSIADAKEKGMLPIIYFHGGNEFNPFPSPGKVELYRHFIELGAKAVIAMHTHCPQGYEIYAGCPIVYSMGNFFFYKDKNENTLPSWYYGYMTVLDITDNEITLDVIPYRFDKYNHTLLSGKDKEKFMKNLDELSRPIQDEDKLQSLFDAWSVMWGIDRYMLSVVSTEETRKGGAEENKATKNVFSCEAHNELLINSYKILYDESRKKAETDIKAIEYYQNVEI